MEIIVEILLWVLLGKTAEGLDSNNEKQRQGCVFIVIAGIIFVFLCTIYFWISS